MRIPLLIAWVALAGLQTTAQETFGSVTGTVRDGESDGPLAGVQVSLTQRAPLGAVVTQIPQVIGPGGPGGPGAISGFAGSQQPLNFGAVTDGSGHFEFPKLPPGNYGITVRRDGYVSLQPNDGAAMPTAGGRVEVIAGHPVDTSFFLNRAGSISGLVTGPDGTTVAGFRVVPYVLVYRNGRRALAAGPTATTDSSGRYRIPAVGPGDYIVGALLPQPRPVTSTMDDWSTTYYPRFVDPLAATPILVKSGEALSEINLTVQKVKTFAIRGRAFNSLPAPIPRSLPNGDRDPSVPSFALVPRGAAIIEGTPPQLPNLATTEAGRRNGAFEIRNVPPGLYDLFPVALVLLGGESRYASGRIPVEVRDRDVENIAMTLNPGVDITGKIRISGNSAGVTTDKLRISLDPLDNIPPPIAARISPQPVTAAGTFTMRNVPESIYAFNVEPLPENTYIADIRSGKTSVFDSGLQVSRVAPAAVEIVLNTNGRTVEGVVTNRKPGSKAVVILVPEKERRQNSSLYQGAISGDDGRFKLIGIAPGDYRIFAWESIQYTAWQNPEFMARYEKLGRDVRVSAKDISNMNIPVIAAENQ